MCDSSTGRGDRSPSWCCLTVGRATDEFVVACSRTAPPKARYGDSVFEIRLARVRVVEPTGSLVAAGHNAGHGAARREEKTHKKRGSVFEANRCLLAKMLIAKACRRVWPGSSRKAALARRRWPTTGGRSHTTKRCRPPRKTESTGAPGAGRPKPRAARPAYNRDLGEVSSRLPACSDPRAVPDRLASSDGHRRIQRDLARRPVDLVLATMR